MGRRMISRLEVRDLNVWFDLGNGEELHAVQGVDLTVGAGQRVGLVGESGCGKTTTVLAMMGLLPPTASVGGSVLLDGRDILARGVQSSGPFTGLPAERLSPAVDGG